jgi:hypothetical protein
MWETTKKNLGILQTSVKNNKYFQRLHQGRRRMQYGNHGQQSLIYKTKQNTYEKIASNYRKLKQNRISINKYIALLDKPNNNNKTRKTYTKKIKDWLTDEKKFLSQLNTLEHVYLEKNPTIDEVDGTFQAIEEKYDRNWQNQTDMTTDNPMYAAAPIPRASPHYSDIPRASPSRYLANFDNPTNENQDDSPNDSAYGSANPSPEWPADFQGNFPASSSLPRFTQLPFSGLASRSSPPPPLFGKELNKF